MSKDGQTDTLTYIAEIIGQIVSVSLHTQLKISKLNYQETKTLVQRTIRSCNQLLQA